MTTFGYSEITATANIRDTEVLLDHQGRSFAPESIRAIWSASEGGDTPKLKSVLVMGPTAKRDGTRGQKWRHIFYEVTGLNTIGPLQRDAPSWVSAFVHEVAPIGSIGSLV